MRSPWCATTCGFLGCGGGVGPPGRLVAVVGRGDLEPSAGNRDRPHLSLGTSEGRRGALPRPQRLAGEHGTTAEDVSPPPPLPARPVAGRYMGALVLPALLYCPWVPLFAVPTEPARRVYIHPVAWHERTAVAGLGYCCSAWVCVRFHLEYTDRPFYRFVRYLITPSWLSAVAKVGVLRAYVCM